MPTASPFRLGNALHKVASISWCAILLSTLLSNLRTASAHPAPTPDVKSTVDNMYPYRNSTGGPAGEIQCYALPYGAIGIISHILTYWTIAWIGVGRTPLWPWHKLDSSKFDFALAAISLIMCVPTASVAINRCRLSWKFVLIAVWKLITSVTMGCVTVHRGILAQQDAKKLPSTYPAPAVEPYRHTVGAGYSPFGSPSLQPPQRPGMYKHGNNTTHTSFFSSSDSTPQVQSNYTPLYWLSLFFIGTIAGMIGLLALIYTDFRHNPSIRKLTYGFAITLIAPPLLAFLYFYKKVLSGPEQGYQAMKSAYWHSFGGATIMGAVVFGAFSCIYCDLVLAAIGNNWTGIPSDDYAPLYWAWFVAKRIPMLSH